MIPDRGQTVSGKNVTGKKEVPADYAEPHCPSLQTGWSAGQDVPQDPQFVLLVFRLTHALPQGVKPGPHPTIALPWIEASWTEGTTPAVVWAAGAAVAAGWVFAESAGAVFVSEHPAERARIRMMRPGIRIERIRIPSP